MLQKAWRHCPDLNVLSCRGCGVIRAAQPCHGGLPDGSCGAAPLQCSLGCMGTAACSGRIGLRPTSCGPLGLASGGPPHKYWISQHLTAQSSPCVQTPLNLTSSPQAGSNEVENSEAIVQTSCCSLQDDTLGADYSLALLCFHKNMLRCRRLPLPSNTQMRLPGSLLMLP